MLLIALLFTVGPATLAQQVFSTFYSTPKSFSTQALSPETWSLGCVEAVFAGSNFSCTFETPAVVANRQNWIGVFQSGSSSSTLYLYLSSAKGSVIFETDGLTPGSYNVNLVDGQNRLRASQSLVVKLQSNPNPPPSTNSTW